jgi:hypothetical protein
MKIAHIFDNVTDGIGHTIVLPFRIIRTVSVWVQALSALGTLSETITRLERMKVEYMIKQQSRSGDMRN